MIQKKSKSLLPLTLLSMLILSTHITTKSFLTKKIPTTLLASAATLLTINEIWSKLSARSGTGDINKRAQKAKIAREVIQKLRPKCKNGSITKEESKALRTAIWHIIDAEWIGYYKTPKNRIGVTFKTSDGRAIVIDAMEKSNGSVGLGKIFQRIKGLSDFKPLIISIITFAIGTAALNKYLKDNSLDGFLKIGDKDERSFLSLEFGIK